MINWLGRGGNQIASKCRNIRYCSAVRKFSCQQEKQVRALQYTDYYTGWIGNAENFMCCALAVEMAADFYPT